MPDTIEAAGQNESADRNGAARSDGASLRVAVVVPCYNEEGRLEVDTFIEFVEERPWLRFVFVNDGSADGTGAVIEAAAQRSGRIRALSLERNQGKAEAVRQGILAALEDGPDLVGFWDADLATPLVDIGDFRRRFEERPELEIVMGARVRLLGRQIERHAVRHYVGRVAASAISVMLGIAVYDTQCGAKLLRTTPRVRAIFDEPFISRWIFDVEILARWLSASEHDSGEAGRFIVEVPLQQWIDIAGSKVRPKDLLGAARDLWKINRRHRHSLKRRN
jgi:glycosyltransferase involved in cell wall biosynthesis